MYKSEQNLRTSKNVVKEGEEMIQICYICRKKYGEKWPFDNRGETSGICPKCLPGELEKLRKWREEKECEQIPGKLG